MSLYKNIPEIATISLLPLMPTNNDKETINRDKFCNPIQLNDSPTTLSDQRSCINPIPFTTGEYNLEPITY